MKVYFCVSLAGGRDMAQEVADLVDFIQQRGHAILDDHVVAENPRVRHAERLGISPEEMTPLMTMEDDLRCVEQADCLIAEVSVRGSYGVGAEIHHCWLRQRLGLQPAPMLLMWRHGQQTSPSAFIHGREGKSVWLREYGNVSDAKEIILEFFRTFRLEITA